MTGFKKILAMTTMLALLVAPTASFGATEQVAEEQAPITMMKSEKKHSCTFMMSMIPIL